MYNELLTIQNGCSARRGPRNINQYPVKHWIKVHQIYFTGKFYKRIIVGWAHVKERSRTEKITVSVKTLEIKQKEIEFTQYLSD